jgi:hypothetical protein
MMLEKKKKNPSSIYVVFFTYENIYTLAVSEYYVLA